jgi:hypothetical protein
MLLASRTFPASILEVQDANTVPRHPRRVNVGANLYDFACGFMRRDYREIGRKSPLLHLEVRVAETRRINLNEKVIIATFRDRSLA